MMTSFSSKDLARYWDKRAKELNEYSFQQSPSTKIYLRSEIELFKRYFPKVANKRLLKLDLWNEVNNTGILYWAAESGYSVHGLDISPYIVKKAKENFQSRGYDGEFIESDIRKIKYPGNHFDYLYTMGTIEHIPDYDKAIKEIHRVLKPKGIAIIGVPNLLDPFLRPLTVKLLELFNKYPYSPEKPFTMNELVKEVLKQDFELVNETGLLFMPGFMRMADVYTFKSIPSLSPLFNLFFKPFEFMERRFDICKQMGYLIAVVVRKN